MLHNLDSDSSKIIEAVRSTGVVVTEAMRLYVDYIVSNMKAIGTWNLCNAVYGFVGGTAASHKFNWKDLRDDDTAFRLVFFNTPTHNSNGVLWNGTNQYANTFLNASTALSVSSNHLSYYTPTNDLTGVQIPIGSLSSSVFFQLNLTSANFISGLISSAVSYTPLKTNGYTLGSKIAANNQFVYFNGSKINSSLVSSAQLPTSFIYLGARDRIDAPFVDFFSKHTASFSSIGSGLTDTQALQQSQIVTNAQLILNRA
jgi:hypothetical protein